VARFGKGNTVTDEPVEIVDHSATITDEQAWDNSPTNYALETEAPGMTNIVDDAPATPASEVPEVPAHDAEATGAKTRRGRPRMGELPELTLDDLPELIEVPESEWDSAPLAENTVPERKPAQVKIDEAVKEIHAKWIEAGRPKARRAPRNAYEVKPELAATTSRMLTRSGSFLKVRVIKNVTHTPQGMARITFSAIDRPPVTKKDDKK
jgi:hypothetical protein